jgi:hypothetical protein
MDRGESCAALSRSRGVAWRGPRYQSGSKQYKTAYFNPILFLSCVLLMLKKMLAKKKPTCFSKKAQSYARISCEIQEQSAQNLT